MASYAHFTMMRRWHKVQRWTQHHFEAASAFVRLYVLGKGRQFSMVRRTVIAWWIIVAICGYGLVHGVNQQLAEARVPQGVAGGTYREGVVGPILAINPVITTGGPAADVSRLVFNGLTKFNDKGEVVGDLAEKWDVSPDGKTYTFSLRKGVKWHDGQPFTARDVEFTVRAIQTPDTRSPLTGSWQGVRAAAVDDTTVQFVLPAPFTPFINLTTVGIIPRHLLEGVDPNLMSQADFNQAPIGTGPFKVEKFQSGSSEIDLTANKSFFGGRPKLDGIVFKSYTDSAELLDGYAKRQVMGVARLQPDQLEEASQYNDLKVHELTTSDVVAVFFKTTSPVLNDRAVRQALATGTDRTALVHDQLNGRAQGLRSPLLPDWPGYKDSSKQPLYNLDAAKTQLDTAGWTIGSNGVRSKGGKELTIRLVTQKGSYSDVAEALAKQWEKLGVKVTVAAYDATDLQQSYIRPRNYDALLYGINLGSDPDEYSLWSSTRVSDPGLNLSVYSSTAVDRALESGRVVRDDALRGAKYKAFVNTWVTDAPAVMLYRPEYLYGVSSEVMGINAEQLVDPSNRLNDIQNWTVKQRLVDRHP